MFKALHDRLEERLGTADAKAIVADVNSHDVFSSLNATVFNSEHKRRAYFKQKFSYVQPVQIYLGRDRNKRDCSFQYVPVLETLKSLLQNGSLADCILNTSLDDRDASYMQDISDGSAYKSNPLFRTGLPTFKLLLYQDAFEVVNPLGSARKKHKLVGVYFTLANLKKHNRSTRDHIQLALLFAEKDIKTFGIEKMFDLLLRDLLDLELNGILFDGVHVKGTVICILGDNLGSHFIGGFTENFSSSTFLCRYCLLTRKEFREDPCRLGEKRTAEKYDLAVQEVEETGSSVEGVKSNSPFNSLTFFHVCDAGLPPCIAHDLFEGVVSYDLLLFIRHFTETCEWFSLKYLNFRIKSFKFLGSDTTSKPCEVNIKGNKLVGEAVKTWNLLRLLPLFVSHKVDTKDPVWCLYLTLRKVVDIICAPKVNEEMVAYLHVLVEEYLADRKELFPMAPLKPKHHYLLHYSTLITQLGPLINLWTLRFESKHSFFKNCVRHLQNFKALNKTLSERHQLLQAYLHSEAFFDPDIVMKAGMPFLISTYSEALQNCLGSFNFSSEDTMVTNEVSYKGTSYSFGALYLPAWTVSCALVK
ncbi:unnamed protein product [Ixodes pacificus]